VGDRLQEFFEDWQDRADLEFLSQAFPIEGLTESISAVGANALSSLISFFSGSFTVALQIIFIVAIAIMMLFSPQAYRQGALKLFPSFYRRRADEILTQSELSLGNWLTGIFINSLFIASLSGVGLWILQIKLVLVHALMAGILNFIPNIGPAASVIFPLMIAVLDAPWKIIAVLILYFIIQNVESYWLTPIVMAKQVSLLPAVTLMAQLFFASMFGLLGLILALPLTVVFKTWIEEALFKDLLDNWQIGNE
jgi:predicted PurR-regulated permease PerM